MDVALLLFLIVLNALFAMSEMALTASRKARLQVMVEAGDAGARHAMDLHENPTKFLSVVQIGITARLALKSVRPRELAGLRDSLLLLSALQKELPTGTALLKELSENLETPTECLALGPHLPWLPRPLDCVSCTLCVLICPANALEMKALN